MQNIVIIVLALSITRLSIACEESFDRSKVEFFEKLYSTKIKGVKLIEQYDDPDLFYSAIGKQVGIPKIAFEAVRTKYDWKQDNDFFLSAMIKGGPLGDCWAVMVSKIPNALKTAKTDQERLKLIQKMEMKMVLIGYDGTVSIPEENKKKKDDKKFN